MGAPWVAPGFIKRECKQKSIISLARAAVAGTVRVAVVVLFAEKYSPVLPAAVVFHTGHFTCYKNRITAIGDG